MRRSQRISNNRTTIECITITDSEDDEAPLPRQQRLDSSSSDIEAISPPPGTPRVNNNSVGSARKRTQANRSFSQPSRANQRRNARTPPPRRRRRQSLPSESTRSTSRSPVGTSGSTTSRARGKTLHSPDSATSSSYDSTNPNESVATGSTRKLSSSSSSSSASRSESTDSDDNDNDEEIILRPPRRVPVLESSASDASQTADAGLSSNRPAENGTDSVSRSTSAIRKAAAMDNGSSPSPSATRHQPQDDQEQTTINRATQRQLVLDRIAGAVNSGDGVDFVVKWRGIEQMERVPMDNMRVLFPREVLDYMCQRIKWRNDN